MVMSVSFFFFFKQKTAYEMRISDWSSDVCSSDLWLAPHPRCGTRATGWSARACSRRRSCRLRERVGRKSEPERVHRQHAVRHAAADQLAGLVCVARADGHQQRQVVLFGRVRALAVWRSEEHTSELQSLMRTQYAVF